MFAGRRITIHAALRVGDEVQARVDDQGRHHQAGPHRPDGVRHREDRHDRARADSRSREEQDIVYREEPDPNAPPPAPQPAPGNAVWSKTVTPDPVMLFRYSALTFNGHRIHYDHPYVTQAEGYPELVMNGGLTTLLRVRTGARPCGNAAQILSSRNVRPLFVNRPLTLCGEPLGRRQERPSCG